MNNPKIAAPVCAAVAAWLIYGLAIATERPSTALALLKYALIAGALLGLAGATRQMLRER
jgi:hypothetical protein